MNRDYYEDRDAGRFESPLGEGLEMQAFPRRKKRKSPAWVIAPAIFVGLLLGFIMYAMSQPEEEFLANVTPDPNGVLNSLDSYGDLSGNEKTAPPSVGTFAANGTRISTASAEIGGNPLAAEMEGLELVWRASVNNIKNQKSDDKAQEMLLPVDVAHADIWEYISDLVTLEESDGIWYDTSRRIDGSIEPDDEKEGRYLFAQNLIRDGKTLQVIGKVDVNTHAILLLVKQDGKTLRFFESIRKGNGRFVQLMSADGPYRGILYYQFMDSSAMRCAFMPERDSSTPKQYFGYVPKSWETFIREANMLFTVGAPKVDESAQEELEKMQSAEANPTGSAEESNAPEQLSDSTPHLVDSEGNNEESPKVEVYEQGARQNNALLP